MMGEKREISLLTLPADLDMTKCNLFIAVGGTNPVLKSPFPLIMNNLLVLTLRALNVNKSSWFIMSGKDNVKYSV